MTSLRSWLVPTVAGPFLTMWSIIAVLLLVAGQATVLGQRLDTWSFAMLLGSAIASGLVVMLIVADLVLISAKARMLPMNGSAWASSLLSPLFLYAAWMIPFPITSLFGLVVYIAVTMAGAAFGARLVLGTAPK